ncbi:MAG: hypothetical protein K6F15_06160 [Treponema sp.]|nr:hypothetical protein [Treponema sp.]
MTKELKFNLITRKYKELFLPNITITMANNLAAFVDTIMISLFLGVSRMPTIQLCFPVLAFMNFFQTMFGIGGSLLAANAQADYKKDKGNRIFTISICAVFGIGCLGALAGTLFRFWIIPLICSNPDLINDVSDYFSILVLGFPLMCFLVTISYFLRVDGCAKLASSSILISNAVNLSMDCFLIKGMGLGIKGAALATIIGYICGVTYLVIGYMRHPKRKFRFTLCSEPNTIWKEFKEICSKGESTASVWLYLLVNVQVLNTLILNYGGTLAMQAYSICKNSLSLGNIFFLGTAQTMQPIVGVYTHRGDYERARYILKYSIRLIFTTALILILIFTVFPQFVICMYGNIEAQSTRYFRSVLHIYSLALPGVGFSLLMNYYFQSIDKKKLSKLLTAFEALLPAVLACPLALLLGMNGVWSGLVGGEFISMILIFMILVRDRLVSKGKRSFLQPVDQSHLVYEFTVKMNIPETVKISEKIHGYMESLVGSKTAMIVCLALEEMLTGIVMENIGKNDVIDVRIRDERDEIVILIQDMGVGFNPLSHNSNHSFDNAEVLQKIASDIKYDLSLGMNVTTICLAKHNNSIK